MYKIVSNDGDVYHCLTIEDVSRTIAELLTDAAKDAEAKKEYYGD